MNDFSIKTIMSISLIAKSGNEDNQLLNNVANNLKNKICEFFDKDDRNFVVKILEQTHIEKQRFVLHILCCVDTNENNHFRAIDFSMETKNFIVSFLNDIKESYHFVLADESLLSNTFIDLAFKEYFEKYGISLVRNDTFGFVETNV